MRYLLNTLYLKLKMHALHYTSLASSVLVLCTLGKNGFVKGDSVCTYKIDLSISVLTKIMIAQKSLTARVGFLFYFLAKKCLVPAFNPKFLFSNHCH